jgi:hypothetical protein
MSGCLEGIARLIAGILLLIIALGILASCAPTHLAEGFC